MGGTFTSRRRGWEMVIICHIWFSTIHIYFLEVLVIVYALHLPITFSFSNNCLSYLILAMTRNVILVSILSFGVLPVSHKTLQDINLSFITYKWKENLSLWILWMLNVSLNRSVPFYPYKANQRDTPHVWRIFPSLILVVALWPVSHYHILLNEAIHFRTKRSFSEIEKRFRVVVVDSHPKLERPIITM